MGSTFVAFRGKGFDAYDSLLEIWLHLLVEEMDTLDSPPSWLQEVRDDWHLQSTAGFGFGVMPGLDEHVINDERRLLILSICERAITRLEQSGDVIPVTSLHSMQLGGPGAFFTEDVPVEVVIDVGTLFMNLLR